MATVEREIAASPERVFAVLTNGWCYPAWVIGTSHVRAVEEAWPAPGSRLFHTTGVWPFTMDDETVAVEAVAAQRLVLIANGRHLGRARVTFTLTPVEAGTRVHMDETPVAGPGRRLHNPLNEWILRRRTATTLARLAAVAEARTRP